MRAVRIRGPGPDHGLRLRGALPEPQALGAYGNGPFLRAQIARGAQVQLLLGRRDDRVQHGDDQDPEKTRHDHGRGGRLERGTPRRAHHDQFRTARKAKEHQQRPKQHEKRDHLVERTRKVQQRQFQHRSKTLAGADGAQLLGDVDGQKDRDEHRRDDAERPEEPPRKIEVQDHAAIPCAALRRIRLGRIASQTSMPVSPVATTGCT